MLKNQLFFQRYENQLTSDVSSPTFTLIPLETSQGLKLVNPLTKESKFFSFEHEQLCFDWSQFLKNQNKGGYDSSSVDIIMEDGSKLILKGDQNLLSQIYRYTVGKYIFKRGNEYTVLKNLSEDHFCQIRIVFNQNNGQQYFEKVILSETNQEEEEFSMSNITLGDFSMLPEEIQIIFDLHRISTPHLLSIDSIFYDNVHYSYIYSKKNDYIGITQYYNTIQQDKQCLLIQIAKKMLDLLLVLEDKFIVFPNIHHQTLHINPETLDIILINYNQAFYCNKNQYVRKGAIFGYAPPEYFQVQTQVTTKANIFQVGVLLFSLLFGHSPYGKDQQEIMQNSLKGKLDLTPLHKEKNSFFNFIELLLEKAQQKRPKAEEALKHSIFFPMSLQKLSFKSINSYFSNKSRIASTEEFSNFNQISNVQIVRSQVPIIKKH